MMTAAAAALALAALFMTGCSQSSGPRVASAAGASAAAPSSTGSPMPSPAADDSDRAVQFQRCMAQYGVQVQVDSDKGGVDVQTSGADKARVTEASEHCRIYLPGGRQQAKPTPEELEQLRQIVQCIRDKGFPGISDPDPETGQFTYQGPDGPVDGSELKNNPQFRATMDACQTQPSSGSSK